MKTQLIACLLVLFFASSCKNDRKQQLPEDEPKTVTIPPFDKDSAFAFVKHQVGFGPRVPGSEAHRQCGDWLVAQLKSHGATVTEQRFPAKFYTGGAYEGRNIIGAFNPEHKNRILLAAHWDTRFIADEDPDAARRKDPILGADDGGSGVGVLLEVARQIAAHPLDLGVDILFLDAEDQGDNDDEKGDAIINTWCMGAQYWAKNPHVQGYRANYGILLDMVGAHGARFTKEAVSRTFANRTLDKVWALAANLGYGNYFVDVNTSGITDDHYFINEIAKIPMIDIINRPENERFGKHWHTHGDDMSVIDPNTLKAVGKVVQNVIYKQSLGGDIVRLKE
jgi:glutaminyl-peptide cyclotransferase